MKIGSTNIDRPIVLAPMLGFTDVPFRSICKRLGADLLYTETIRSDSLVRNDKSTLRKMVIHEKERPIAIQLFGSHSTSIEKAIKIVEKVNPNFIDINCGCPLRFYILRTPAVRNSGAVLLKNLPKFESIIKSAVKTTKIPITVKTRLGWDTKNINILNVAKMVEQAGAKSITVHCRTRAQGYRETTNWSWLEKIKRAISIPVIGNGDIFSPDDAKRMFETGCDGIMIGRAAIFNPWIFKQIKHYLTTSEYLPKTTIEERIYTCVEFLKLSIQHKGKNRGLIAFRRNYSMYLGKIFGTTELKYQLTKLNNPELIIQRLHRFLNQ